MRINADGLDIVKQFEGLVDGDPTSPGYSPYLCPANIPTIGYGATQRMRQMLFLPRIVTTPGVGYLGSPRSLSRRISFRRW